TRPTVIAEDNDSPGAVAHADPIRVILAKGMRFIRNSDSAFLGAITGSPNLRISLGALLALTGLGTAACNMLPGGNNGPTAPSGPPASGSAIRYTALGASDAIGHGSSSPCLPWTECAGN